MSYKHRSIDTGHLAGLQSLRMWLSVHKIS